MYGWDEDSFFAFFNDTWDLRGIADDDEDEATKKCVSDDIFDFQNAPPRRADASQLAAQRTCTAVCTSNLEPRPHFPSYFTI
jgi:hypothetical protein